MTLEVRNKNQDERHINNPDSYRERDLVQSRKRKMIWKCVDLKMKNITFNLQLFNLELYCHFEWFYGSVSGNKIVSRSNKKQGLDTNFNSDWNLLDLTRIEKLEKTGGIRIRSKEPRQALKRRLSNYDVGAMVSKTERKLKLELSNENWVFRI